MGRLEEIRARAEAATKGPWSLDHNDTYVAADKEPPEHDWYWISGSMEEPSDGYFAEHSDEDMRGPELVVQNNCRFIAHSRSDIPFLLAEVERLKSELSEQEREWEDIVELKAEVERLKSELKITEGQRDDESGVLELVAEERDGLRAAVKDAVEILEAARTDAGTSRFPWGPLMVLNCLSRLKGCLE